MNTTRCQCGGGGGGGGLGGGGWGGAAGAGSPVLSGPYRFGLHWFGPSWVGWRSLVGHEPTVTRETPPQKPMLLILAASAAIENGLPMKFTPGSSTPWWTMALAV